MPDTREDPAERFARAELLQGTPGGSYVQRRGIPIAVAEEAGVRFDPSWAGRPAVIAATRGRDGEITSVHGRYLEIFGRQNKMLTAGPGGGVIPVLGGLQSEPLILVEGLFDALSLAACGWSAAATIGRWAPWLAEAARGRQVWLAFDDTRPAEADVARYVARLAGASLRRIKPPPRCKDWNTALRKRGRSEITSWLRRQMESP